MRLHHIAGGMLAAALLSSVAVAQTTTAPPKAPMAVTATAPHLAGSHWRASKMIGVNVYNDQNEKLGSISEIIIEPTGKVAGYVVGVGGFLGMGEHDILVEPSQMRFVNEPVRTSAAPTNPATPMTTRDVRNTTDARAANVQWYPDHAVLNATKDQLKAMPQFKY